MARRKVKENMSRLPVWAQHRIRQLESAVLYHENRCQEMSGDTQGDPETGPPILADPYADKPMRLPRGTVVRFMLEEGEDATGTAGIDCFAKRDCGCWVLQIRAAGGDSIVIRPEAANSAAVRAKALYAKGGF